MRLSRIYSSKLYTTNPRKDRIHAAINNPMNVELVQQLSDLLDDDAKAKLDEAIAEKNAEREAREAEDAAAQAPEAGGEEFPDEENNVFSPSFSGGGHHSAPPSGGMSSGPDIFGEPEGPEAPAEGGEPEVPAPEVPEAPVEESSGLEGDAITADTDIDDVVFDIANESNVIKGTLNSRGDTAGVLRIAVDDNELWVYYKDEVNIGDIMVDVIETLNGANYTYLTFSRLARSNNAIVFDINLNLNEPVKSVVEVQEENK